MDGWMDRWMDGDEWIDGWMDGWIDWWVDGWVEKDGRMCMGMITHIHLYLSPVRLRGPRNSCVLVATI
jgi:hypothetical protein